jgi:tRNA pseudouridine55 synthase
MTRRHAGDVGLDGILVVAKPAGPTSHDVVALVRRLTSTRRIGHGGTLDPFAGGVLPLFLGRATRMAEYHLGDPKAYRATVCFGATSTTDDLEGELRPVGSAPTRDDVEDVLPRFRGRIVQQPPAYSAIKVAGRRAYAMARAGERPELPSREVDITRLELVSWDASDPERPIADVEVECSAGTYVRALARDIGAATGGGAYLGALTRTRSGPFRIADAASLDDLRAAASDGSARLGSLLLPADVGLDAMPVAVVADEDIEAIARGQHVRARDDVPGGAGAYRLRDATGRLLAIATLSRGRFAPDKVFVDPGAAPLTLAEVEANAVAELDPPSDVDPDPASPDDADS